MGVAPPGALPFQSLLTSLVIALGLATPAAAAGPPLRALLVTTVPGGGAAIDPFVEAGFELRRRPVTDAAAPALTREDLAVEVVVLGSYLTEAPAAVQLVERSREALRAFVRAGGTLLELAQRTQGPISFLPPGLQTQRLGPNDGEVHVIAPRHPLLAELPVESLRRLGRVHQLAPAPGFRVLLASEPEARFPIALEGALGRGRILLLPLTPDRAVSGYVLQEHSLPLARSFAGALHRYVRRLAAGKLPRVEPTPPYRPRPALPFKRGAWTLVVLPDTQVYSQYLPQTFEAQTRWIAKNRDARRIAFVTQVGDLVEHDTPAEWAVADRSLALLDGVVPYAPAIGNHDFGVPGADGQRGRFSLFDTIFPRPRLSRLGALRGAFPGDRGKSWNTYWTFEAGGQAWLLIALEFGPRRQAASWAREILARYPERRAIIVTHAYLYSDDTRYDLEQRPYQQFNPRLYRWLEDDPARPTMLDGEGLWRLVASRHPNVRFVLSGHVLNDGVGRLASRGLGGNVVHQLLANYQARPNGGDGFLRLLEFQPDRRRVYVKTYSPLLDQYRTDAQDQFVLELDSEQYRLRP